MLNTGGQLDNTKAGPAMQQFGLAPSAVVAGLAVNKNGSTLYAANYENDAVTIIDTKGRHVTDQVVFSAPGSKKGGGRVSVLDCGQAWDLR